MGSINLGYAKSEGVWHWEFVFLFLSDEFDDSTACPEDCHDDDCDHGYDEDYFHLVKRTDTVIPHSSCHILHAIEGEGDTIIFDHMVKTGAPSSRVSVKEIGRCDNTSFPGIIERCRGVSPVSGKDCQDWVWSVVEDDGALEEFLFAGFEEILHAVKNDEMNANTDVTYSITANDGPVSGAGSEVWARMDEMDDE